MPKQSASSTKIKCAVKFLCSDKKGRPGAVKSVEEQGIKTDSDRRRIPRCNVTQYPTAKWIVQQLREAFPEPCRYRYAIFDRDRKVDAEVVSFLESPGLKPKQTCMQSH
jgi:hypothetical protein